MSAVPIHFTHSREFLAGGGEMGALIRAHDWSRTPLGAPERWSPTLRMMVSLSARQSFSAAAVVGPQYISIYNDAYRPMLGSKHPNPWGNRSRVLVGDSGTSSSRSSIRPFNGGPATWMEDIQLEVNRHGFVEETHFTIAYSPVPDEAAPRGIGGVLATVHEITEKVVGERRVAAFARPRHAGRGGEDRREACAHCRRGLARHLRQGHARSHSSI